MKERQEAENRPLSRKALELLRAAKEPLPSAEELSLVELLRMALERLEPPQEVRSRAQTTLELADQLLRQQRFLAAYKAVVGQSDSREEPAWAPLLQVKTLAEAFEQVVKLSADWPESLPLDLEHPKVA